MIGDSAGFYRLEIAVSDPRQGETWWREYGVYAYKAEAIAAMRAFKKAAVRIISVNELCVEANNGAKILMGDPTGERRTRRRSK